MPRFRSLSFVVSLLLHNNHRINANLGMCSSFQTSLCQLPVVNLISLLSLLMPLYILHWYLLATQSYHLAEWLGHILMVLFLSTYLYLLNSFPLLAISTFHHQLFSPLYPKYYMSVWIANLVKKLCTMVPKDASYEY